MRISGRVAVSLVVLAMAFNLQGAKAQEKIKITMWGEGTIPENERPILVDNFVNAFNVAHPNIELNYEFTDDQWNVTRTAIQGGAGPDIVIAPGPAFVGDLVTAGAILPLDAYDKKYGWKNELQPWAYYSSTINGKLWSVPLTSETMLLMVNETQFDKAGWKPPTSLKDIVSICEAATKIDKWCFSHSNQFWQGANEWLISVTFNNLAGPDKVYEALTGKRKWTDPLFVQSVDILNDWMKKGWFSGSLENYFALDYDDHMSNFCSGKAVMSLDGTWALQDYVQYCAGKDEWDWVPIPPLREGGTTAFPLAIGTTVSINAKSPHPDEAAEVLDWLYSDKARAAKIAQGLNFSEYFVPLKWTSTDLKDPDKRIARYIDAMSDAVSKGNIGYATWSFWPPKTDQDIIQDLDLVFSGSLSSKDYLQKQQDDFDQESKDGIVPPIPPTNLKTLS